jgi:hypothetical protein
VAAGSLTVTLTIPTLNLGSAPGAPAAANALTLTLLQQVTQQIGASGATSGSVFYPTSATAVGSWSYTPST